jgi:hypothetical protein
MKEAGEESNMASPIELALYLLLPTNSSAQFRRHICIYHLGVLQITMRHTWSVPATRGLNNEIFGSNLCKISFGVY